MEKIIVTEKELLEWAKKQPNERKLNMSNISYDDPCGCLMVQYGKENFKEPFSYVGSYVWRTLVSGRSVVIASLDRSIDYIVDGDWDRLNTFGELKKRLKL